jgi:1-acyl-sn-glycerol-3-phosphate acyltransferase
MLTPARIACDRNGHAERQLFVELSERPRQPRADRCPSQFEHRLVGECGERHLWRDLTRADPRRIRRYDGEMGPLLPDDGPRGSRIVRRVRGIALELVAFVLVTVLFPLLAIAAVAVDLTLWIRRRKPWMAIRLLAMMWWFLVGELRGLAGLLGAWVLSGGRDSARRRAMVYRVKRYWLGGHLRGIRLLFGLRFESEGLELAGPGPILLMIRHASIIDNTLPDVIVGGAHGLGFRFVIKRELELLPTIDIGGRWVPTMFVRRGSGDTEAELEQIRKLAIDLGPDEGLLIYPEGTRYTAQKLARAKEVVAERQPELTELVERLGHVLPPRLGGTLALLEASRGADVVVFGHVGLDGFEYVSDIWSGELVGSTVRMKLWRHRAEDVPDDRDALIEWLYARWQELDDWIEETSTGQRVMVGSKAR